MIAVSDSRIKGKTVSKYFNDHPIQKHPPLLLKQLAVGDNYALHTYLLMLYILLVISFLKF